MKFLAVQRVLVAEYGDVASNRWYYGPTYYQIHVAPHYCHMLAAAAVAVAVHMLNYCMLVSVALPPALDNFVAAAAALVTIDIDCKPYLWY